MQLRADVRGCGKPVRGFSEAAQKKAKLASIRI
jgi:hypothetical protein